jgi:hypothetical protein
MRAIPFLASLVVLGGLVACGAPSDDDAATTGADLSASQNPRTVGTPCSVSRQKILSSTSTARQRAIQRGFKWLDDDVPYSQSASHEGYRTDCSGFVSMCWELGESSNTSALFGGDANHALGSWNDLLPADAVVKRGHVMMFVAFDDASHDGICVLEQSSTKNDMQFRVHPVSSLKGEGYKPIRATKLAKDTGAASGASPAPASGEGGDDDDDSTSATPQPPSKTSPPRPTTPSNDSAPGPDGVCIPPAPEDACGQAFFDSGFVCGSIHDGCGGIIDCDTVPLFGCAPGQTCGADHTCSGGAAPPPGCTPKTAAQACPAAKAASGLECGSVPDGCGGTVSCLCAAGQTCDAQNHCGAKTPAPDQTKTPPATPTTPDPSAVSPTAGDPGDDGDDSSKDKPAAPAPAPKKKTSGCSAAPNAPGGETPTSAVLGFAAVLGLLRRRARRLASRA